LIDIILQDIQINFLAILFHHLGISLGNLQYGNINWIKGHIVVKSGKYQSGTTGRQNYLLKLICYLDNESY